MGDLIWRQAGPTAIQRDDAGTAWHSGHANAVLPYSTGILIGADTGGVWFANELGGTSISVSDWDAPNISSLAHGPDGQHYIFAGGVSDVYLSAPEVVTSPDQLHAFVVGNDHALWHYLHNACVWSAPESLGTDVVVPSAVCSSGDGRIDLFVIGTDGALYHKWWDGVRWGPSQTGYERLGGTFIGQPSAIAWGPNRLDVFAIGTDHVLYPVIGMLHETDVNALQPIQSWREIAIPHAAAGVAAIVVFPTIRKIVLGRGRGLWWSPIPPASARGAGYAWTRVPGLPDCGFFGVAATGDDTFVAAAYGSDPAHDAYGFFTGQLTATQRAPWAI